MYSLLAMSVSSIHFDMRLPQEMDGRQMRGLRAINDKFLSTVHCTNHRDIPVCFFFYNYYLYRITILMLMYCSTLSHEAALSIAHDRVTITPLEKFKRHHMQPRCLVVLS